jgi:polysaccharide biosynthesis protein PslH
MKLLVMMTDYPFPLRTGNANVAFYSVRELSKRHTIDFACYEVPQQLGEFVQYMRKTEFVPRRTIPRLAIPFEYTYNLLLGIPTHVTAHMSDKMKKCVKDLIEQNQYDAILAFELSAIQYCPVESRSKCIANIEDPESIKLARIRKLSVWSLWQKIKFRIFAYVASQYEHEVFPSIGKVLLLSDVDMDDLKQKGGYTNLGSVPYGVTSTHSRDINHFELRRVGMIVFSGSMYHRPNVDGILYFLKNIFPSVLKGYPEAVLWIVGSNPDKRIYTASASFKKSVVITGWVENVSDYLEQARVSICPVRLKIGVQTKVLEAMSCGTPVVTFSAGNSGIGGVSGKELWVEDNPEKFAQHVVELLRGDHWSQLSEEGRILVENRFSWRKSVEKLEHYITEIQSAAPAS